MTAGSDVYLFKDQLGGLHPFSGLLSSQAMFCYYGFNIPRCS